MLFQQIEFWYWWVAAVIFIVIEIFAPGAVFLWMGIAAGLVGLLLYALPATPWEQQFLIFAVLSVAAMVGWRFYQRRHPIESDQPTLNRRGAQYVGRDFNLDEPIVNGSGKIRVDDTTWKVVGEDMALGTKVRVTAVEGTVLRVEQA